MSGNLPVSGLEEVVQPLSSGDLMIISQETAGKFTSAQIPVEEFLSKLFDENSGMGGQFTDLSTQLKDLEARVDILETNPAIRNFAEAVFHVGSKHMTTSTTWNPGKALTPFFGKRTNWILYPYVPYGVVSEDVPLGGIIPLLKGNGTSVSNMRIWERLPDNAGNYLVTVKPNKTAINEGDEVTFTIAAIGVEPGTVVHYQIIGMDDADISPNSEMKLTGSFINSNTSTNTITLKTIPNRRTDGDRTIIVSIPDYQSTGSFTLIDTSKALDGVINVLPGTSQVISLAPNQQADVWVTGAGGSGGISESVTNATLPANVNFIKKTTKPGVKETISVAAGEEIEVWMWGAGADCGAAWAANKTLPPNLYGNGEPSRLNIGGAVITAGGGTGIDQSNAKLSTSSTGNTIRYNEDNLPGGVNSIITGDYNGLQVTVLENTNGAAGGRSPTFTSAVYQNILFNKLEYGALGKLDIAGEMQGAGHSGFEKAYSSTGSIVTIGGGGAGGFIRLRIKNPTTSAITFEATAGRAGHRADVSDMGAITLGLVVWGNGGQDGAIQILSRVAKTVTKSTPNQQRDVVVKPGKSAEIWLLGSGGAFSPGGSGSTPTKGDDSWATIGTAKYIAGGGGPATYLPGSGSGGVEKFPTPGKNTIPTSGLPANVTVSVLANVDGPATTIVESSYGGWSLFVSEAQYAHGYGPFSAIGYSPVSTLMGGISRAPAAGAMLGLLVKNNGTTDLVIPTKAAARSIAYIHESETPGIAGDKYEMSYRKHGGHGTVLSIIESGSTSAPTEWEYALDATTPSFTVPANGTLNAILIGGGGGGGAMYAYPRKLEMIGVSGGDTILTVGTAKFIAGGGKGGGMITSIYESSPAGRYPGAGGTNTVPITGLPAGVSVEVLGNDPGETPPVDSINDESTKNKPQRGGNGWMIEDTDPYGAGGYANDGGGHAAIWSSAGGGSGGKLWLRITNDNPVDLVLPVIVGKKGTGGKSANPWGYDGADGAAAVSEVAITISSAGYNGEWSYVAFQSPLITNSSSPYIEEIYWATDEAGNNKITNNLYGDHAYLIIKTIDVEDSVELVLSSTDLTQDEMGGGQLDESVKIPITKIGTTNKGIGSYLIQTLDDDEMSFRNSKPVDVTAERAWDTEYTNTSDYTIYLSITIGNVGGNNSPTALGAELIVDGVGVCQTLATSTGTVWANVPLTWPVPPGKKYKLRRGNVGANFKWVEGRYKGLKQ